jgi:hypothetical protein
LLVKCKRETGFRFRFSLSNFFVCIFVFLLIIFQNLICKRLATCIFFRIIVSNMQVLGDFRRKATMTKHCSNLHHWRWDH